MERLTKRIREYVYYTQGKYAETIPFEMETEDVRKVMHKLADYEDAEEQGLLANVVRGRWIDTEPDYHNGYYKNAHQCSNCQDYYTTEYDEMNYCPNCGAKMKTKEEAEAKLAEMRKE